jgi:formylglycine-generating enzyme required for sulfatase activity
MRQRELEAARRLAESERARAESQAKAAGTLRWLVFILTLIALVAPGLWVYRQVLRAMARGEPVDIPASKTVIGSDSDLATADERPVWTEEILAFSIERYEVTNRQYRLCRMAGACSEPTDVSLYRRADLSAHPVVTVNAFQAAAYCQWLGRRLPTELEWERAARGEDGRLWPWGDDPPDPTKLNVRFDSEAPEGTRLVGSYPSGATPEGAFDVVGNVWEWTATAYQPYPYDPGEVVWDGDPTRVPIQLMLRGGGWQSALARSTVRISAIPSFQGKDVGFRCARSSR